MIEKEFFSPIDTFFSKTLLEQVSSDTTNLCLEYLMYVSRKGHLCLAIEEDKVTPNLIDSPSLEKKIIEDFYKIPYQLFSSEEKTTAPLIKWDNYLYLQKNWVYESKIVSSLKKVLHERPAGIDLVKGKEKLNSFSLTDEQKNAIEHVFKNSLTIICGGPGTGKTFTAAKLIAVFHEIFSGESPEITITAPTGKAVSYLEEKLSGAFTINAKTLHALLKLSPNSAPAFSENILTSDLIIVDEASMIDAKLMAYLLSSIKPGARLVLMGDPNQLPPVDVGSVFSDLSKIDACFLRKSKRFENDNITTFASLIEKANAQEILQFIQSGTIPFYNWNFSDVDVCLKKLSNNFLDHIIWNDKQAIDPKEALQKFQDFKILTCMRKGPFGVDELNQFFFKQAKFRKKSDEYLAIPIIVSKNDYLLELFNGMSGVLIIGGQKEKLYFLINGQIREFDSSSFIKYEYGFALSVHKSQGSEFNQVLTILPKGSETFGREILYTAVTRAKKNLTIAGSLPAIEEVIRKEGKKHSTILKRL
ncbi:MAG: AAA family ATPase [Chlamydiota bacterium]|jgi:exodeoxyribonuclease V alpha subunit